MNTKDESSEKWEKFEKIIAVFAVSIILVLLLISNTSAYEFSGYISTEGKAFSHGPLFSGQEQNSLSLSMQPEFYHELEDGSSFVITPFARFDSADPERTHFDIRELNYLLLKDTWELRVGIGKVFWGVTEFIHLVDIINQTDMVEDISMEEKLGQPMVHLSILRDWGIIDLFVLPYFRERTFPGKNGRLRAPVVVDSGNAEYEHSSEERHIDFAARYSHTAGDWDFGIYHFKGTGREPTYKTTFDFGSGITVVPFYDQIDQTGIDIQAVKGSWLLKLESLYRTGQGDAYAAAAGGFEYTFTNIVSSGMDLGLIGEWAYDERGDEAATIFENDLIFGTRLALNDAASTDALIGLTYDIDNTGNILLLDSSRRIGDRWKVNLNAFFVINSSSEDFIHTLRDDDFIQFEVSYYF